MKKCFLFLAYLFVAWHAVSQVDSTGKVSIHLSEFDAAAVGGATVLLIRKKDSALVDMQLTDSAGSALFAGVFRGVYVIKATHVGYKNYLSPKPFTVDENLHTDIAVRMELLKDYLHEVTVNAYKPFIELSTNKTVINMESGILNTGTSSLEALEKLPGITIDRNGGIALKGKPGVLVLIDGKQSYLSNTDLATFLSGLGSEQISEIEIMEHPSSKYEASGNAGIINIKTKKSVRQGMYGSIGSTYSQARFPKNNNSVNINMHEGAITYFANYNLYQFGSYTNLYAYRKYFEPDNKTLQSILEQNLSLFAKGYTHSLRSGIDYALTKNASVGVSFNAVLLSRNTSGKSVANWENKLRTVDSTLFTSTENHNAWNNGDLGLSYHQKLSSSLELNTDVDFLTYKIKENLLFKNSGAGGMTETYLGDVPGTIHIISAKSDFTKTVSDHFSWEAGWKLSHIHTDNLAAYSYDNGSGAAPDLSKSNHFLYIENDRALYSSAKVKTEKWSFDGGLRYEYSRYNGHQLGNALLHDTMFVKTYNSLFPNIMISYAIDSSNEISLNIDRRIDRPAYQKLNPFIYIINKYTYQTGNPAFLPQFTWSGTISHNYKGLLISSISYTKISDYFSQLFYSNANGLVIYTEGNVGSAQDFGVSESLQLSPFKWWNFTMAASMDYKTLKGNVVTPINASITQMSINLNNQFHVGNWSAELAGNYNSESRTDIQELIDPVGQMSAGISRVFLQKKLTVKVGVRDIFHTQVLKGLTQFQLSNEYFRETRDTRMGTISLIYRFGKSFKSSRRSIGAAEEEIRRSQPGN